MEILTLILTVIHLHVYNKGATVHSPTQPQSAGNRFMSTIRNTFNFRRRSDRNSRSTQKR